MGMQEVDEASTFIKEHGHKDAEIIWGAAINPDFEDQMMITVIATGFNENEEAAEKKFVAGIPAMPFDALAETKDNSNSQNDESNPESEIIFEENSKVITDHKLLTGNYDYTSQNIKDDVNIDEPSETKNTDSDEIIQLGEDRVIKPSDSEVFTSQLSDDHAKIEELDAEKATEKNSESSNNTGIQMNQKNLEKSDDSETKTTVEDKIDHMDANSNVENNSTFEDFTLDMTSDNLIDAENYSIHDSALESKGINDETFTENDNNLSYSSLISEKDSEPDTSDVETSPLIPEWANQTDNPAFFQNLDIPTFLRKLGSNRPRQ